MSHEEEFREAVASRLQEALADKGESIRGLHQRLDQRDVKHSSYGAVRSYVQGERDQPLAFLTEAADVLGVRVEWLLLGSGERTAAEERAAEKARAQKRTESGEVLLDRIAEEHPKVERLSPAVQSLFLDVLASYALGAPDGAELMETEKGIDTVVELAGRLLFLLFLPLRWKAPLGSWGFIGYPQKTSSKELSSYAVAMLHALQTGIPEHGEGKEVAKAEDCLIGRLKDHVDELEANWEKRSEVAREES